MRVLILGGTGFIGTHIAQRLLAFGHEITLVVTLAQLGAGASNLALLAPIGMQILHLFLADLVWISLVLLVVEAGERLQGC